MTKEKMEIVEQAIFTASNMKMPNLVLVGINVLGNAKGLNRGDADELDYMNNVDWLAIREEAKEAVTIDDLAVLVELAGLWDLLGLNYEVYE